MTPHYSFVFSVFERRRKIIREENYQDTNLIIRAVMEAQACC
jgi:hypothetical protein